LEDWILSRVKKQKRRLPALKHEIRHNLNIRIEGMPSTSYRQNRSECSASDDDSEVQPTNIVDRMKLRRIRNKVCEQNLTEERLTEFSALYFDGRKDKTAQTVLKGSKRFKMIVPEEHISIIKYQDSVYIGYVVPAWSSAKIYLKSDPQLFDD
jgi:hypothetical protein